MWRRRASRKGRADLKPETLAALERLQEAVKSLKGSKALFLDQHREDVLALLQEKDQRMTAELLGLSYSSINLWCSSRKVGLRELRAGAKPEPQVPRVDELPPEASAPYWRGYAQAYQDFLLLLLGKNRPG